MKYKIGMRVTGVEFRVTGCELRVSGCGLRVTSYELRVKKVWGIKKNSEVGTRKSEKSDGWNRFVLAV
ncbi:MAG: hypothetical protein PVI42_05605 [Desulfobacterales bacterium]